MNKLRETCPPQVDAKSNRTSIVHGTIMKLTAMFSMAIFSAGELMREKSQYPDNTEIYKTNTRLDHKSLTRIIRNELPNAYVTSGWSARRKKLKPQAIEPVTMIVSAIDRLSGENMVDAVKQSISWLINYQLSVSEQRRLKGKSILDCNDRARAVCEKLSVHGIPMYMISVWPEEPYDRLQFDFHQFAACKLGHDYYLVINNGLAVFWRGSLAEYAAEYCDAPMRLIPVAGISEFKQPLCDIPPAKFLLQIRNACPEDNMGSLNILPPYGPMRMVMK